MKEWVGYSCAGKDQAQAANTQKSVFNLYVCIKLPCLQLGYHVLFVRVLKFTQYSQERRVARFLIKRNEGRKLLMWFVEYIALTLGIMFH